MSCNSSSRLRGCSTQHRNKAIPNECQDVFQLDTLYRSACWNCLSFEISDAMLNQIDKGFCQWVKEYEKWAFLVCFKNSIQIYIGCTTKQSHSAFHMSFNHSCPSTYCMGYQGSWTPIWTYWAYLGVQTYWAYPMERHCNTLLQAIKSRRHPHASINSFVTATAQLDQIRLMYNLHEVLCLDYDKEKSGLIHDSCKF